VLLEPGSVFLARYRIVTPATSTDFGELYTVDDLTSGAQRVLEFYLAAGLSDALHKEAFLRATRWAMGIDSPRVVRVHAAGIEPSTGLGYTVLDLVSAPDLQDQIWASGPLGAPRAAELVAQLLEGAAAIHATGTVHGELDPQCVLVGLSPDGRLDARIHDLVHRRFFAETRGQDPEAAPRPVDFIAPELARAGAIRTPASDLWAIGLIAFLAFSGRSYWMARSQPDRATALTVLREILMSPLVPASVRADELGARGVLPEGFDGWFERCVSRDAGGRFASAKDAAAAWTALRDSWLRAP